MKRSVPKLSYAVWCVLGLASSGDVLGAETPVYTCTVDTVLDIMDGAVAETSSTRRLKGALPTFSFDTATGNLRWYLANGQESVKAHLSVVQRGGNVFDWVAQLWSPDATSPFRLNIVLRIRDWKVGPPSQQRMRPIRFFLIDRSTLTVGACIR